MARQSSRAAQRARLRAGRQPGPGPRDWRPPAGQRRARRQLQPDRAARIGRHGRGLAGPPSAAGAAGGRQDRSQRRRSALERMARTLRQRFAREAQATAELQSPHTVQLFDFGVTDTGSFYYVMERLRGMDLQRMVERSRSAAAGAGRLPAEAGVPSLSEAHALGLVHRDIKPANLFVCRLGAAVRLPEGARLRRRVAAGTGAADARSPWPEWCWARRRFSPPSWRRPGVILRRTGRHLRARLRRLLAAHRAGRRSRRPTPCRC